jgi:hypothetical protein
MTEALRKFVQRAPRYILRPQDRKDMRFSLEHTIGQGGIESTLLLNLSETGVAFVVDQSIAPKVGDRIKVEVPIPQGDRIAWWGNVVRTGVFEPRGWLKRDRFHNDSRIFVAVAFDELPEQHSRALRRGLNRSFLQAMRDQKYLTLNYYFKAIAENIFKILLYTLLTAAVIGFIYYFTLPSSNYDPNRGTMWGERFKF